MCPLVTRTRKMAAAVPPPTCSDWCVARHTQQALCNGCKRAVAAREACIGRTSMEPPAGMITRWFHPACAPMPDDVDVLLLPGADALAEPELFKLIDALRLPHTNKRSVMQAQGSTAARLALPQTPAKRRAPEHAPGAQAKKIACPQLACIRPATFSLAELTSHSAALEHLQREGYLVIRDLFPPDTVSRGVDLFWQALSRLNPAIDRNDRATWTNANFPGMFNIGIASFYGLCQTDFMWLLRSREEVKRAFAAVHALPASELVASMDAFAVRFDARNRHTKAWLHVDQLPHLPGGDVRSVQGGYNFLPVGEEDAGLVVVPRSHAQPALPAAEAAAKRAHFCPLPPGHGAFGLERKLLLEPNCLVLWDSRLVHANTSELRDRPPAADGSPQLNRLTAFVCMMPRALRSAAVLEKKREAYRRGRGTTHWAIFAQLKPADARWPAQRKPFEPLAPALTADGGIPPERDALL